MVSILNTLVTQVTVIPQRRVDIIQAATDLPHTNNPNRNDNYVIIQINVKKNGAQEWMKMYAPDWLNMAQYEDENGNLQSISGAAIPADSNRTILDEILFEQECDEESDEE